MHGSLTASVWLNTNYFRTAPFYIEGIIYSFYKASYLNMAGVGKTTYTVSARFHFFPLVFLLPTYIDLT